MGVSALAFLGISGLALRRQSQAVSAASGGKLMPVKQPHLASLGGRWCPARWPVTATWWAEVVGLWDQEGEALSADRGSPHQPEARALTLGREL